MSSEPVNDHYFPEFSHILEALGSRRPIRDDDEFRVSGRFIKFLISEILAKLPFDESYYANMWPDVVTAVEAGRVKSLRDHFVEVGYFEGRSGGTCYVDRDWYLSNYPDIAKAFSRGQLADLTEHFNNTGRFENRDGSELQQSEKKRWATELNRLSKALAGP
jgi:hypothetical protein